MEIKYKVELDTLALIDLCLHDPVEHALSFGTEGHKEVKVDVYQGHFADGGDHKLVVGLSELLNY
jgi:hypothetical protein